MSIKEDVLSGFKVEALRATYELHIREKCTPGVDRVNRESFERNLDQYLATIENKVFNGKYVFTRYKQKLILKGANKYPRVISIPTIRDKITLKTMQKVLSDLFSNDISQELIHVTIQRIKDALTNQEYDYFLKFDIQNFYPSINHKLLLQKVRLRLKNLKMRSLLSNAIKTPTSTKHDEKITKGVPQGLSISNILADIYLLDMDRHHFNAQNYQYFRYVDDILILCNANQASEIENEVLKEFKKEKLKVNTEKTMRGSLGESFQFLGYQWNGQIFSVRLASKLKIENSLIRIFTELRYSKFTVHSLLWNLNLRITGCKYNDSKYGWLFFFSQIDDLSLLYHLDHLVRRLIKQYDVPIDTKSIKRFVRTYHEIRNNLSNTNYIPDFDNQSLEQKKGILQTYFGILCDELDETEIINIYHKKVSRVVKDLEADVQGMS